MLPHDEGYIQFSGIKVGCLSTGRWIVLVMNYCKYSLILQCLISDSFFISANWIKQSSGIREKGLTVLIDIVEQALLLTVKK